VGGRHLTEFDGKQLQSVAKGGLDLGKLEDEAEKEGSREGRRRVQGADRKVKTTLGEQGEGRARHAPPDRFAGLPGRRRARPRRQPARILKAAGQQAPASKPILEINPNTRRCSA
jgi:molecular chaperone HtpG